MKGRSVSGYLLILTGCIVLVSLFLDNSLFSFALILKLAIIGGAVIVGIFSFPQK